MPNIDRAVISVHCHNDLGMATANSITAVQHGARQIECCMNGLGERAGNCSLEEVAMAIKLREKSLGGLYTGINPKQIARTSGLVSKICSEPVPAHKAIVGSNAFAHSSGIHQDGVLKNRETYEILTPESVGFTGNTMRMTARSGRHMIRASLANMGYKDDEFDLNEIYARFLKLADKKGQVFDYDLEALLFCSTLEEEENTFGARCPERDDGRLALDPDRLRSPARRQAHPQRLLDRQRSRRRGLQLHRAPHRHPLRTHELHDIRQRRRHGRTRPGRRQREARGAASSTASACRSTFSRPLRSP